MSTHRTSPLVRHDLIERAAIGEMRLLRLLPASEHLLDREGLQRPELARMLREHVRVARPQMMLRDDLLRRGRVQDSRDTPGLPCACRACPPPCRRSITGGSASRLIDGYTASKSFAPGPALIRPTSFSNVTSTSPMPRCVNVVVAPRPPVSSTGTFLKMAFSKSCACASVAPCCFL